MAFIGPRQLPEAPVSLEPRYPFCAIQAGCSCGPEIPTFAFTLTTDSFGSPASPAQNLKL